jgi:hypothetical protein
VNFNSRKTIYLLSGLFVVVGIIVFSGWMFYRHYYSQESSVSPSVQEGVNENMRTYTNTEYGLEFQYPKDWSIHENVFNSPFSKFNLIGTSPEEVVPNTITPSFILNIVTPDFVDRQFSDLKNSAVEIIVDGAEGLKYEYNFEGFAQIAIDLPLGKYRLILGANKQYENVFNQIIASFRFLK